MKNFLVFKRQCFHLHVQQKKKNSQRWEVFFRSYRAFTYKSKGELSGLTRCLEVKSQGFYLLGELTGVIRCLVVKRQSIYLHGELTGVRKCLVVKRQSIYLQGELTGVRKYLVVMIQSFYLQFHRIIHHCDRSLLLVNNQYFHLKVHKS